MPAETATKKAARNATAGNKKHSPVELRDYEDCEVDPENFRLEMPSESLLELLSSIREHGIQENCVGYLNKETGKIRFMDGNRRLTATGKLLSIIQEERDELPHSKWKRKKKLAELAEQRRMIPVRVLTDPEEIKNAKVLQLMLNLQSEDVGPIAEARGFDWLIRNREMVLSGIAEQVGKSSQYVSNRLKLNLCPESLLEATADPSVKLPIRICEMVAGVPGQIEREALASEILNPQHYDRALRESEVRELIERSYKRDLSSAAFDVHDATLDPSAGACSDCPHRSGNMAEIQERSELNGKRSGQGGRGLWICTKVSCFDRKKGKFVDRQREEAGSGVNILEGADARKVFAGPGGSSSHDSKFSQLAEKPTSKETGHYDREKVETWSDLLEHANDGLDEALEARRKELISIGKSYGLNEEQSLAETPKGKKTWHLGLSDDAKEHVLWARENLEKVRGAIDLEIPKSVAFHPSTAEKVEVVDRSLAAGAIRVKRNALNKPSPFDQGESPASKRKDEQKKNRDRKRLIRQAGLDIGQAMVEKISKLSDERACDYLLALVTIILEEDDDAAKMIESVVEIPEAKGLEGREFALAFGEFAKARERSFSDHVAFLAAALLGDALLWEAGENHHVSFLAGSLGIEIPEIPEV